MLATVPMMMEDGVFFQFNAFALPLQLAHGLGQRVERVRCHFVVNVEDVDTPSTIGFVDGETADVPGSV